MATEKEASLQSCASDPNFAVICSFLNQFANQCGIAHPTFRELQDMLEDTQEVSQVLIDLHIKLLRKARKSFTADKWEKALAKFCHTYSQQDGWELERFGYKKARLGVKVKLLKVLLETQFDVNGKFKTEVNKVGAKDLRLGPLGRDQNGFQYWCQFDKSSHVRIYREDLDDEIWELVASDRDGLVQLIDSLSNGEGQKELNSILNEDSTSQEVEKPITDTGQEEDKLEQEIVEKEDEEDDEEEEEVEEEEEDEDDDGDEDEDEEEEELGYENQKVEKMKEREQKPERIIIKQTQVVNVSKKLNENKVAAVPMESNNERVVFNHSVESNTSLTGVDLSIKSESKKYVNIQNGYYSPIIERPYLPERNDILSQMSARFNEIREAEDLSINPLKKTKLNSDQPMMLVKKDIKEVIKERVGYLTNPSSTEDHQQHSNQEKPEFSEVIEEPMRHVVGLGSGVECDIGNPRLYGALEYGVSKSEKKITLEEPEFSEVIEEPIQFVVGLGSGVECDIGNPKLYGSLGYGDLESKQKFSEEEPEFSEVIEEPIQYVIGIGSGVECDIGNPKFCDESQNSSSCSVSTMGIECSLRNLSLLPHEPNFSDVIEEPVMFVHGFGYGQDCLTGNPDEVDESVEDKSPEKKPKLWSIDAICSSQKLLPAESLGQLSESSLKDFEAQEGSSRANEDNGPTKSFSLNSFDDVSVLNVCDSGDISLKPSSDVKPILENIPMKDKPPDCNVSDIACLVPNLNKESNSLSSSYDKNIVLNESIKDSLSSTNVYEELEVHQVSNTESVLSSTDFDPDDKQSSPDQAKSSEGVQTSEDISSDNFTSDDKLTIDDQPSTDPSVIDKSSIMPTTSESDVKSFSEDNSRNSVISEEFVRCKSSMALSIEDRDNSNMSEDCLGSRSSSNLLSADERDKSDCSDVDTERLPQRKLKKSFNDLPRAELDIESRSSVSSDKSSSKRSKCSTSSKNSNTSYSSNKSKYVDEGVNSEKNKSQIEMCMENSKVELPTKETLNKINVASFENGSNVFGVSDCSVVCEKLSDVPSPKQNLVSVKTSKRTGRTAKNTSSSSQNSQKESGIVSTTDKNKNNSEPLANNPVSSDKTDEKRKNVMLTNIIEVCLDNDTNSRDNGQLNAKFNDLFSAKNLLEPSVDISGTIKKEKTDLDDTSNAFTSNLEIERDENSKDDSRSGLKGKLNAKFSDLISAKNLLEPSTEISNAVKKEEINDPEEVSHTLTSNSEGDDDSSSRDSNKSGLKGKLNAKFSDLFSTKNLNEPSIKSGSAGKLDSSNEVTTKPISENCIDESYSKEKNDLGGVSNVLTGNPEIESNIKHENGVSIENTGVKEEKLVKNPVRGRKSRTNSLNNEQETEVPNKIRKTDNVQINKGRRLSRRNTRSTSQAEATLEPEEEKVNKSKVPTKTKLKKEINENSIKTDTEEELSIKDVKNKNEPEKVDNNEKKEEIEGKLKKENEVNENIKGEMDSNTDKLSHEEYAGKDSSTSTIDTKNNKGFTLSSFSLEQPVEDGPVLGRPLDFKALQSRKRRNSRKLSRSEEDGGGEVEDEAEEEEEAGGKKPRLRGKTRRSKGTPPTSHRPAPADSSSDDQADDSELTPTKEKDKPRRPRGRPLKKRGGCGNSVDNPASKSKFGKKKESEKEINRRKKESRSDEESDSEEEEKKQAPSKKETHNKKLMNRRDSEKEENKQITKKSSEKEDKKQSSSKKEPKLQKKSKFNSKEPLKKGKKQSEKDNKEEDTDNEGEEEDKNKNKNTEIKCSEEENDKSEEEEEEKPRPKKGRPKKRTLLGLMESDLLHSKPLQNESEGSRVRQSRRIAQIKIKEEAERRAIEEATMLSLKETKKKSKEDKQTPKKQRKKNGKTEKVSEEEDETFKEPNEEKKRGRKKKKKRGLKYDINKPWQSSSDSSSEEAEEEEEHFEEEDDEEDIRASKVISDHEFSPESDLEEEEESVEPVRRARTAKKVDEDVEQDEEAEGAEDYPCKKCGQPDHPEWILLCDKCDSGYHASCLRPPLMLIPEGDWFCPPCQHVELVSKLKETLRAFERNTKRRENEELRKKRLAYVGISLANVLPTQEKPSFGGRRIRSESSESSSDESESSEEEPVYQLRQRRAALQANYRFNDYDDLINSAIQDEMEAVKGAGNMGRGKDIANIVEAEKKAAMTEEGISNEPEVKGEDEEQGENWRPPVVPKNTSLPSLRKKPKKLTDLDKQSDDDQDSDEDFKGSSEEEDYSSTEAGDSDDSIGRKQPVRRSSRARISRIDKEFINDETESSDEPRRKKTRRIWGSSSSESSDTTWGRRKRKTKSFSRIRPSKSGKKKKKKYFDSDSDRPKTKVKPKRPKIKYGISDDDEEPIRRTRGKKMSYLEVAGSDTEEEVIARSRKLISEDEEEFVPEKEEAEADEDEAGPEEVEPEEEIDDEQEEEKVEDKVGVHTEEQKKVTEEVEQTRENKINKQVPVLEPENKQSPENQEKLPEDEEDEEDDLVEEEEIEEEIEEEVEEEEEEDYEDGSIEEAKNLVREKVDEPKDTHPPVKIGPGLSVTKVPLHAQIAKTSLPPSSAAAIPTSVIKEEKKEEKKEPTPSIRLVPSAKLLDPNKRRPPEESVIRGMLGGGAYYRPQLMQGPGRQPFRQRYPEQQRYLYQPPPSSHHQFYAGSAFYSGEDYAIGVGYEEQIDPNIAVGDEEGVFSGLVSYFSSQREDNLDS